MKFLLSMLPLLIPGMVMASLFVQVLSRRADHYDRLSSLFWNTDPSLLPTGSRRFLTLPEE